MIRVAVTGDRLWCGDRISAYVQASERRGVKGALRRRHALDCDLRARLAGLPGGERSL
jgi:hypothetical protein